MRQPFQGVSIFIIAVLLLFSNNTFAQSVNLNDATIIISSSFNSPVKETIVRTLQEEVFKRTNIRLPETKSSDKTINIILARSNDEKVAGHNVPASTDATAPENRPEGFKIKFSEDKHQPVLWMIAADDRAALFAIGYFLQKAELSKNKIAFDKKNEIATAPAYALRGHQLGYRNTANSWDAWTVAQYEQYIRELALFGSNAIENTPFHDGAESPVMKLSRREMNIKLSELCIQYGLEYWVWTPAEVDLSDRKKFDEEVKRHVAFYRECPRLDGIFFPGGDPGRNDPKDVLPFLKELAHQLKQIHPKAGIWLSLQNFSDAQVDYFYAYLEKYNPDWLTGVVSGPSSPPRSETRFRLPAKYKHRDYPDITHTVRCEYPTPDWDQAYALTEGREMSNPEPYYYAKIFQATAPFTDGFLSYSDGVHDDVNKIIWSQLAWNPQQNIRTILKDYGRFFFGNELAAATATGILGLEQNWRGAIESNGGIEMTYQFWRQLAAAHPELKNNWRWQMLLMRCYYDTYTARRNSYEKELEKEANEILQRAPIIGAAAAMRQALDIVNKGTTAPIHQDLRQEVVQLLDDLYHSIGLQSSVELYHAKNPERGAVLDFLDYPLNNRWWLHDEFEKIRQMKHEDAQLARLHTISTWEHPGAGSYYDNVSNIAQQPHVLTHSYDATDVAWWDKGMSRKRLSTQLFQGAPRLVYDDLDPDGHYTIRISGYGEALLRVNGERIEPSIYNKGLEEFKEFPIGRKYVKGGKLTVTFDEPEESHLNWRQHSKVSDIWLLKNAEIMVD